MNPEESSMSSLADLSLKDLPPDKEWAQGLLLNDEWANYLTHSLAFLLSFVGLFFLLRTPLQNGDLWKFLILGIYCTSSLVMYAASTIYHYLRNPLLKKRFRIFDHCAIYLFIAGTYTPFTLLLMKDEGGLALFGIIWGMTSVGIAFKLFFTHRFNGLSVLIYLTMGWLVIAAADTLFKLLHIHGVYWLFAGGMCYTLGIVFYLLDKRRFFHAIWHLFTLAGSFCHYICILVYL